MKCANCMNDAMYEYKITAGASVLYCGRHIPRFLHALRDAGNLTITPALSENLTTVLEILTPTAVEETDSEEVIEAPKKKAAKKKAE